MDDEMTMALSGIRVLDWTQYQAGPVAGMMLADLGADVIKIEEPIGGDPARGVSRLHGLVTSVTGRNAYFEGNNRNKRGITVNLRSKEGVDLLRRLVQKSDVFLHNFRDSVALRLGLDYESLRSENPRLIYAEGSGLGTEGPDKDSPAFDYIGLARSGIMTMVGEPDTPPMNIQGGIADQIAGTMLAYGVLAAIVARERLGVGQRVEASLLSGMLWLQGTNVNFRLVGGMEAKKQPRASTSQPLYNHYCCQDGKWLVLAHLQAQRFWPNVCRAMGMRDLQDDPRFDTMENRREHAAELITIMDKIFASKPLVDWIEIFRRENVIHTPVNSFDDLGSDPQILANGFITSFDHPTWGPIQTIGMPIKLSETPGRLRREAPEHGQHTEEVLMEILGCDWDEVIRLRELGAI